MESNTMIRKDGLKSSGFAQAAVFSPKSKKSLREGMQGRAGQKTLGSAKDARHLGIIFRGKRRTVGRELKSQGSVRPNADSLFFLVVDLERKLASSSLSPRKSHGTGNPSLADGCGER
jgi:hypothetical protein